MAAKELEESILAESTPTLGSFSMLGECVCVLWFRKHEGLKLSLFPTLPYTPAGSQIGLTGSHVAVFQLTRFGGMECAAIPHYLESP